MNIKEYKFVDNIMFVLSSIWKWEKKYFIIVTAFCITIVSNQYIPVYLSKFIVDIISNNDKVETMLGIIILFIIAQLLSSEIYDFCEKKLLSIYINIRLRFINLRIKKAFNMDYANLENVEVQDCLEKAKKASSEVEQGFCDMGSNPRVDEDSVGIMGMVHNFVVLFVNLIVLFFSIIQLSRINGFIIVIMFILAFFSYKVLDIAKKTDYDKFWSLMGDKWRKASYLRRLARDTSSAKDIRLFDMQKLIMKKYEKVNVETHIAYKKHYYRWILFASIMQFFTYVQELVLYAWLVYSVLTHNMTIGNFVLYLSMVRFFSANAIQLFDVITTMKKQSLEVSDYRKFIEYPDKLDASSDKIPQKEELVIEGLDEFEITFCHVYFRYHEEEKYILKDINIKISSGKKYALVGLNGAGKTTIIKLIMRIYEPTSGCILLNGVDIRNYKRDSYYKFFAPVFQDAESFAATLAENVSMQLKEDMEEKMVVKVLKDVGMKEKIVKWKNGIDVEISRLWSEEGIELSGGEKQKMLFARALYKDASVLILDEPTAAMDSLAEYNTYKNIEELAIGKTVIYISHRLSSTRFCDEIFLIQDGKLIEQGKHDELLEYGKVYANIFEKQAYYYRVREEKDE